MVIGYLISTLSTTFQRVAGQIQRPFMYFFNQEGEVQQDFGDDGEDRYETPQRGVEGRAPRQPPQPVLISNAIVAIRKNGCLKATVTKILSFFSGTQGRQ